MRKTCTKAQTPLTALGEAVLNPKAVGRVQAVEPKIFQAKLSRSMDYQRVAFFCWSL